MTSIELQEKTNSTLPIAQFLMSGLRALIANWRTRRTAAREVRIQRVMRQGLSHIE